ncbi:MAG: hypothetical protein ACHRXM_25980 [Isosphaerales bacterium]
MHRSLVWASQPQPRHRDVAPAAGYTENSVPGRGDDDEHLPGAGGTKEERPMGRAGEREHNDHPQAESSNPV